MAGQVAIRVAEPKDAKRLQALYAPYVEKTAITFEYEIPSAEEFGRRIEAVLKRYPYLTAYADGELLGFAYAGVFKERAAYGWAVETSIYVDGARKRCGVGRKLHDALESALREQGILNMNACIGCPPNGQDDEYLTMDSIRFHSRMGYRMVGEFYRCGYKFDRWYNMAWMEKQIGRHEEKQAPVKTFESVRGVLREKYGIE
ncbi:MAG: GNAT family N-acetyltransferase [Lachnospiraceae bacterium]|nr:GNAT family N-acetyltransferase [Lachnospiraceae bacterium]